MFSTQSNQKAFCGDFHLDRMMHYSVFVPRLCKLCKLPGFEAGRNIRQPLSFRIKE